MWSLRDCSRATVSVKIRISSDKDIWQWWYLGVLGVLACRTFVIGSLIVGHYSCATAILLSDSLGSMHVRRCDTAEATYAHRWRRLFQETCEPFGVRFWHARSSNNLRST